MKDLILALIILSKYTDDSHPCGCEHDEFRVYVDPAAVSQADVAILSRLSFEPDYDCEAFLSHRFGSA